MSPLEPDPKLVRLATPEDEQDLMVMVHEMYPQVALRGADGQPIPMDAEAVYTEVRRALTPYGRNLPSWIGVIGDCGALKASIFIACEVPWCSTHVILVERWLYVRPEHRRSNFAATLIDFAKRSSDAAQIYPLMVGHSSPGRVDAKSRFYSRYLTPLGASYVYVGSPVTAEPKGA